MSNLLQQLRANLIETTATASFASYSQPRRRRMRKRDAVDRIIERSKLDESLVDASALWMESRTKIMEAGLQYHPIYRSVMVTLRDRADTITESEIYDLHEELNPLLEKADSSPMIGGDFIPVHDKFVKAFAREFKVEVTHHEPVAEGLFLYTDTADTVALSRVLNDVRKFAHKHKYVVLKKGTTDDTRVNNDAKWIFVFDQNASKPS